MENILNKTESFLDKAFQKLENLKIDVNKYHLDHLCYRVNSENEYQKLKTEFLKYSKLLIESPVNGRLISTFKLNTPIIYKQRKIDVIELPSPKKNTDYPTGFEHIEFVIDESFESFSQKYPSIDFDKSSAKKNFNPEMRIKLDTQISVKFHHLSLEKVIEIEKAQISL